MDRKEGERRQIKGGQKGQSGGNEGRNDGQNEGQWEGKEGGKGGKTVEITLESPGVFFKKLAMAWGSFFTKLCFSRKAIPLEGFKLN